MQETDNSLLEAKVLLRAEHLPAGDLIVLDCFGGFGVVWAEVAKHTGRHVMRSGIDKQPRPGCVCGDNRKWMKGITLQNFTVIDLDAYGVPFDQMEIVFKSGYKGTVFFTFILVGLRCIPRKLIERTGIKWVDASKCMTIFGKIGWKLWLEYLSEKGVKTVYHRSCNDAGGEKHYGCFVLT